MCIVVDINTLAPVFNEECEMHAEFSAVERWISSGGGVLLFGGTKYIRELSNCYRYLRLINQMKTAYKAVHIDDTVVDREEARVVEGTAGTDCDDQHIIALLCASRCTLLCSNDRRSYQHIKNRALYPRNMRRVRIYTSSKTAHLLVRMDISKIANRA